MSFGYFREKKKTRHFEKKLATTTSALNTSQMSGEHLQGELSTLKNQLQNTLVDPVTNLPAWQIFENRLQQCISESSQYQLTMGVVFIDIDNFKMINVMLGADIGDALLRETAQRLQLCVRQLDCISRIAKDNFVVMLSKLAKPATAAIVAQRMLQALAQPYQINGNQLNITASIGLAIYPADGEDGASLLRSAEHAMHLAKEKANISIIFTSKTCLSKISVTWLYMQDYARIQLLMNLYFFISQS